ncbi:SRPBCC family protein [Herbiconiux liukaitaii]|uniref:SRPBCC family protein n=1 Tax=Herbiconiux liukaitaii TaxID=3342799 RepID=UPI0035B9C220
MEPVVFTAAVDTVAGARVAFDRVVPRDDSDLFTGYLVLPAVTGVTDQTGPWTIPGSRRTVHLSDGGTFHEHLLHHTPPPPATPAGSGGDGSEAGVGVFDYRVTDFTGALSHLVSEATARWRYEPTPTGSRIRWTYEYVPLPRRRFVVERLIGPIWRRYMTRSLAVCARVAEGG